MTDQTRWGIDLVQQKNKQKAFQQQTEMREEIKKYISDCNVFNLHKIYDEIKRLQERSSYRLGNCKECISRHA